MVGKGITKLSATIHGIFIFMTTSLPLAIWRILGTCAIFCCDDSAATAASRLSKLDRWTVGRLWRQEGRQSYLRLAGECLSQASALSPQGLLLHLQHLFLGSEPGFACVATVGESCFNMFYTLFLTFDADVGSSNGQVAGWFPLTPPIVCNHKFRCLNSSILRVKPRRSQRVCFSSGIASSQAHTLRGAFIISNRYLRIKQ